MEVGTADGYKSAGYVLSSSVWTSSGVFVIVGPRVMFTNVFDGGFAGARGPFGVVVWIRTLRVKRGGKF